MHHDEDAYYITDLSLMALAEILSGTSPPLLTLRDGRTPGGQTLQGAIRLTDMGRAVLRGTEDKVATCGIDRWLGGVHLQPGADRWRWSAEQQTIVAGDA